MKNSVKDYQWPSFFIRSNQKYNIKYQKKIDLKLINELENYFQKYYGFKIILFPSARAGIASILRFLKIDRSKEVFVNKWVSYCIFNTLGKYTNISTNFKDPDVAIAVHKWGYKQIIPKKKNIKIIEDSVDSIIMNRNDLFENEGDFEIISLPKIIGSVSGGIVITKDINFYEYAKMEQIKNKELGQYQSRRKFEEINKKKTFHSYFHHESTNTFLEYNALLNIAKCLKNFQINKNVISERQKYFKKKFNELTFRFDRLGPVIPLKYNLIKNHKLMNEHFLLRRIHKNKYKIDTFKKVYLLPIHFKITHKKFKFYLAILKKCIL
jgi:putative PLP-dependent aminotransferase (TIGR04422 family)